MSCANEWVKALDTVRDFDLTMDRTAIDGHATNLSGSKTVREGR
jgi:hypothetical protein